MSRKDGHDIDFFRGNLSKEELEQKKQGLDDSYTFSDFNFKKKNAEKEEQERLLRERLQKQEELRLREEALRRQQEQQYNQQRQDEMAANIENQRRQRMMEEARNKENVDPKIASGERKPLKPRQENSSSASSAASASRAPKKKRSKRRGSNRARKIITRIIIILLILLMLFIGALFLIKNTASPVNLVVIGVDQRENQDETEIRADALMSVNAGSKTNKIIMGSIPRDTYTYIPCEEQKDKITHAYFYGANNWADKGGGIACTVQSVKELTSINTSKYVKLNFDQMVEIIDAIDGIDLKSTATFCEQDSKGHKKYHLDANGKKVTEKDAYGNTGAYCYNKGKTYHMDGERALAYSRHRKSDDDIQRGLRQQEVFKAVFKRVKTAKFWEWPGIYINVTKMLKTNLSQIEMLQVAMIYATNGEMENYKFDWGGAYYNGVSYVELSDESVKEFTSKVNALE